MRPHTTPRAIASFIKKVRPYIFGLYIECESDVLIHNYLTYHVFGKLAWNTSTDVEKLLDEHARLFYGPAAVPMKDFFDSIERNWQRIAANVVETSEGPKTIYPSELILWSKIYSPDELKRLNGLFDKAEKLAAKDKLRLERIRFVRKEFMEPLMAEADKFNSANDAVKAWTFPVKAVKKGVKIDGKLDDEDWKNAPVFHLSGLNGKPVEVMSTARMTYDKENFYFALKWDEPFTAYMNANDRKFDEKEIWKDSTAEVFISPDGNRDHYYQVIVNPKGKVNDLEVTSGAEKHAWNSGADIKVRVEAGKAWYVEMRVPRKSMCASSPDGIRVNFARHRSLTGEKTLSALATWSPFIRKFSEVSRFGKLLFNAPANEKPNLLKNPDFEVAKIRNGAWTVRRDELDHKVFMTGGNSVRLECGKKAPYLYQRLSKLQPNKEYEVCFFVKLDKVKKLEARWSGFYIRFDLGGAKTVAQYFPAPPVQMDGSCNWTGFKFRVKTPSDFNKNKKAYISFVLRKASGVAWVDHVSITEVTQ